MPISVFPERMDKLDPEDVNASLRTLETYIHYICERTEYAITNTFRTTTGLGSSAEAISLVLQVAVDNLSAVSSQLADAQTNITRLQDDVGGLADNLSSFEPLLVGQSDGPAERVVFTAPGEGLPLKACTAEITPVQEGEGDPSPENVRPIAGWTGLHLHVSPTEDTADEKTYTVDWTTEAGTVYGGTLDVLGGTLTVDRLMDVFNGSETWGAESTSEGISYYCNLSQNNKMAGRTSGGIRAELKMNWLATRVSESMAIPNAFVGPTGKYINLRRTGFANLTEMETNLSQTPLQVVYPLAEPITYYLTPQMVTTLAGQNNVWADCGNVTVEYGAFLAALQAEIERLQEGGN